MFRATVRGPIWALILISLGGLGVHIKIHPPLAELVNLVPFLIGLFNVLILPFLFNHPATVRWAHLLNIGTVVAGGVGMAYFSLTHWSGPVTVQAVALNSTLPDIVILLARLPLGAVILSRLEQGGES
jgi:hypothetical protein